MNLIDELLDRLEGRAYSYGDIESFIYKVHDKVESIYDDIIYSKKSYIYYSEDTNRFLKLDFSFNSSLLIDDLESAGQVFPCIVARKEFLSLQEIEFLGDKCRVLIGEKEEMTLEEAIEHCREKSKSDCECAKEHKQLLEWLLELQSYREGEKL